MISAIIPALNEARTIGPIIQTLKAHPAICQVVVVDDGSTDRTGVVAKLAGAEVISLGVNRGKTDALAAGVRAARYPFLFFVDGDLIGLSVTMVDRLVLPVLSGASDVAIAVVGRRSRLVSELVALGPLLSGIRLLPRWLWERSPMERFRRFQVELALNYFARAAKLRITVLVLRGLSHRSKEEKRGLGRGLYQQFLMLRDIFTAWWRLYVRGEFRWQWYLHGLSRRGSVNKKDGQLEVARHI